VPVTFASFEARGLYHRPGRLAAWWKMPSAPGKAEAGDARLDNRQPAGRCSIFSRPALWRGCR
jgi:hypothetical protein